jgi:hypothetical protein
VALFSPSELKLVWLLRPDFYTAVLKTMNDFEQATGLKTVVVGGLRSTQMQSQIYSDSLSAGTYKGQQGYRAAPPGQSKHEWGSAVDLNIVGHTAGDAATDHASPLYEKLATIAEANGLKAGQHFKTGLPDPYHLETNDTNAQAQAAWSSILHDRLWRGLALLVTLVSLAVTYFSWRRHRHAMRG